MITSRKNQIIFAVLMIILYVVGGLYFMQTFGQGLDSEGKQFLLSNYSFSFAFYSSFFVGAVVAIFTALYFKLSRMSMVFLFLGLGLLAQTVGSVVWDYNEFYKGVELYPSSADYFYLASTPLLAIGMFYLLSMYKIFINKTSIILGVVLVIVLMVVNGFISSLGESELTFNEIVKDTFTVFYDEDVDLEDEMMMDDAEEAMVLDESIEESEELTVWVQILDFLYKINDAITLALAILILMYSGGKIVSGFKVFAFGFFIFGAANIVYLYRITEETYYTGDWGDYLYIPGACLMSYGVILMSRNLIKSGQNKVIS